jgi:lysozyme family protein
MWKNFEGAARNRADTLSRIVALQWIDWQPRGITLHNTAAPTLAQWSESGPSHDARIRNLQNYYENELGWHAGPHFFVSRDWINWFSNPLQPGVHSRCWNSSRFGIEMVGDFGREEFDSGDGAKVRDNAIFLIAALNRKFGFRADDLVFHKECTLDNHDCPGRKVDKADVIVRVKAEMTRQNEAIGKTAPPPPAPIKPVALPIEQSSRATLDQRRRMAKAIIDFEARRDRNGHLAVYNLPANDGGGRYEVAGINERYNPEAAKKLATLLGAGKYDEAEIYAADFILGDTAVAAQWTTEPGVEFMLRDCVFNRGANGAARILQRALNVPDDGVVGPLTMDAISKTNPDDLLQRLRDARENYERNVVGYRANFWQGLVNRWDNSLMKAKEFQAEKQISSPISEIDKPAIPPVAIATSAVAVAATGGTAHWLGAHPFEIAIAAGIALMIVAAVVVWIMDKKEHA